MPFYTPTEGDDRLVARLGGGAVNGLGGNDYIYGTNGSDDLNGGPGLDWLEGGDGDDVLRLTDTPEDDRLLGGAGIDTLVIDARGFGTNGAPTFWEAWPDQDGGYRAWWEADASVDKKFYFSSIEKFDIRTGNGRNWITLGDGDDRIVSGDEDDVLNGGGGADWLEGGKGNDVYVVDNVGDVVLELDEQGWDEVRITGPLAGGITTYRMPDHVEALTIVSTAGWTVTGNAERNHLRLGDGNDVVDLSAGGMDRVEAGGGNDFIYFGAGYDRNDTVDGGDGKDTVGLQGSYTLAFGADSFVRVEQLTLFAPPEGGGYNLTMHDANVAAGTSFTVYAAHLGPGHSLVLNGSAEKDGPFIVSGGRGADTITGGAGADIIAGGEGADHLRGGAGADVFHYDRVVDSLPAAHDIIYDFERGDRINLLAIDADGDPSNGNGAFAWIGDAAFSGQAGQLRAYRHPDYHRAWIVEADVDGDMIADFMLAVVTQPDYILGSADFLL
jgi:Ca2+-binding RTX toxin-like protein